MRWMTLAVVVLLLAQPGKAFAGPLEKIPGKMIFDEVADGLRKYRKAKEPVSRMRWLEKLAPTRDVRVAVTLYDFWFDDTNVDFDVRKNALIILADRFATGTRFDDGKVIRVTEWWTANETDLRRRAKQLPQ